VAARCRPLLARWRGLKLPQAGYLRHARLSRPVRTPRPPADRPRGFHSAGGRCAGRSLDV
jgi:hypothetical protein